MEQKRLFIKTFAILLLTVGWLLLYPSVHGFWAPLQDLFRTYQPFALFLEIEDASGLPASASAVVSTEVPHTAELARTGSSTSPDIQALPALSDPLPPKLSTYTGLAHLTPFFEALEARREQIRIGYYGDSSIEGDLITQTFRDSLQGRFGGKGVGFVPVYSHLRNFRRSVQHNASNNWYVSHAGRRNGRGLNHGISGDYFAVMSAVETRTRHNADTTLSDSTRAKFQPDRSHFVSLYASSFFNGARFFPSARLFFGSPIPLKSVDAGVKVSANDRAVDIALVPESPVNEIILTDSACTSLRLEFSLPPDLPVYGISLESRRGVIVDNFPMRGNDGRGLLHIEDEILQAFQEKLDYDLILLQFGLNVLNPRLLDYSWYEQLMIEVILHLRTAMPEACILVVGLPDKGVRYKGRLQTDPSVPRITEAQRRAAYRTGVAFFSLYEAMGGNGSMIEWVEQRRLANRDYTHFNFNGANMASNFLLGFLMDGYQAFLQGDKAVHSEKILGFESSQKAVNRKDRPGR